MAERPDADGVGFHGAVALLCLTTLVVTLLAAAAGVL